MIVGLGIAFGVGLFLAAVVAFIRTPHAAVAAAIPYFALLPLLERFVSDLLGGTKDVLTLAAAAAAGTSIMRERARCGRVVPVDRGVALSVGFLLLLYVVNIGGALSATPAYGSEWFHGVRLTAEPLALLLAGMTLPQPARTLRWATVSLVATGSAVAAYGVVQQVLGVDRLVNLGYVYGEEVREIGTHLRSFGTLDDPFSYASFLLLCVVALVFGRRWRGRAFGLLALLGCGLLVSYVRSAGVIALALVALAVVRLGRTGAIVVFTALALASTAVVAAEAVSWSTSRSVPTHYVPLQARTDLWGRAIGHSAANWTFGRGVGRVGTASQRASDSLLNSHKTPPKRGTVVDSGYVATVADVGVIGLLALLSLFGRLFVLAGRAAATGRSSAWVAIGMLTVMIIDALTRESLNGFPTAYVGMLIVGLALATTGASASFSGTPACRLSEPAESSERATGSRWRTTTR